MTMTSEFAKRVPSYRLGKCAICGKEIDIDAEGTHQRTSGWVMKRSGGGGHAVSVPERENKWAHPWCVDKETRGHLTQQKLFE